MVQPFRALILLPMVFLFVFGIIAIIPASTTYFEKRTEEIVGGDTVVKISKTPIKIWKPTISGQPVKLLGHEIDINYFSLADIFTGESKEKQKAKRQKEQSIDALLAIENYEHNLASDSTKSKNLLTRVDSNHLSVKDTSKPREMRTIDPSVNAIKYANDVPGALDKFFAELRSIENGEQKLIRVLHYGDSQLDGGRITLQLRAEFQKLFGGCGAGLVPVEEIKGVRRPSPKLTNSANWNSKKLFGNG